VSQDVGAIINGLGVKAESLADDVLVSDALVLMECVHPDGSVSLLASHNEGMNWIKRLGMLHVAIGVEQGTYRDTNE
jgi:hypothetical protein